MRRFALALLFAAVATGAAAQSALKRHDTNAPIDVDAASIDVQDRAGRAIWTGGVKVRQGTLALDADQVKVFYRRKGDSPEIIRLDAAGNVRLNSPSERATGAYGIYDVERRLLTMTGGVVLNQGGSVLRGQRLVINLETGASALDGRAGGAAAAGAQPAAGGRVSGRFIVPPRKPS